MSAGSRALERAEALWGWLESRARAPRHRELAFAAALLFALFLYLPLRLTFGTGLARDAGAVAGSRPPRVRVDDVDPKGELNIPTPPYAPAPGIERPKRRNPFAYQPEPTPPPTPPPPTPPPPPPPTPPPPTPTPYSPPYSLFGLAKSEPKPGQPGSKRRIAFLKGPDDAILVVLEGDKLKAKGPDGQMMEHIIKKIGEESVTIGPTAFEAEVVLALKGGAGGGN